MQDKRQILEGCSRSVPNLELTNVLVVNQLSTQLFAYMTAAMQHKCQILEGCSRIVPSLRDAEVVADWAGLRPYRQQVRIELEHKQVELAVACFEDLAVFPKVYQGRGRHRARA